MKKAKRFLICVAILVGVFIITALVCGFIIERMNDAKFAPGDKDRKYESISDDLTMLGISLLSMLTVGVGLVVWRVRCWSVRKAR